VGRIRSIHPEQWTDEAFVSCSPLARLLSIALRNEADDQGVFEWKPRAIKMRVLPADNCDVNELLEELISSNQVIRFASEGRQFGFLRNFTRFQKPKKPQIRFPSPPLDMLGSEKVGTGAADGEGEGIGEERREANASRDATVDDEIKALADSLGVNPDAELVKFSDWKTANGRRFKNDRAAFRNWLRKAAEMAPKAKQLASADKPPMTYDEPWPQRFKAYRETGFWHRESSGQPPGHPDCRAPDSFLAPAEIAAKRKAA
jgi:hypothetical protein